MTLNISTDFLVIKALRKKTRVAPRIQRHSQWGLAYYKLKQQQSHVALLFDLNHLREYQNQKMSLQDDCEWDKNKATVNIQNTEHHPLLANMNAYLKIIFTEICNHRLCVRMTWI